MDDNSSDVLQEDIVCEPVLSEGGGGVNDTRLDTYLNSSDVVKYYHGPECFGAYLCDGDGNVLANKTVSFLINGVVYNRVTDGEGYAFMGFNLISGNYSVSCFFNGDDYYKPCNNSNWVFVNSTIFADDLVKYFCNSSQYYSLFFSVNGVPLVNTTVTFNINGVLYNRTTDSRGWASLNINLGPGEYIVTGFNPISGEMHSNVITVLSVLLAEDLIMGYRDGSKFEVTVLDGLGNPYPNQVVEFNINGIFYYRVSDEYGVARLNINLRSGEYIITSSFNNARISNRISVYDVPPVYRSFVLNASDVSFVYNSSFFCVYLCDDFGNPVSGKSVLLSNGNYSCARLSDGDGCVRAIFDNEEIVRSFNKNATIDIMLFSSAGDVENIFFVNKTYHIPFSNNASWITFSWGETGLFEGKIYVIVNGEIIDEINITNIFYQCYKNNFSENVFEAIKLLNNVFASMKEGVWAPNYYYLTFAELSNIDIGNYNLVYNSFLNYLQLYYNLSDLELNFVRNYKNFFVDKIEVFVDYHGDVTSDVNFVYGGERKLLNPPSSYAHRVSNIYYTDIVDEDDVSVGYEGMRSFAVVKSNLTCGDLFYWLDQKEFYAQGLMKAAYGTFLTSLLVIYENDRVADESAGWFNVSWSRVSPVCVSLCNDYNTLYITGESDHRMGREAMGNASGVWSFNFATSFSFSLVEQLVGNNVWNTTVIGSVTLGLIESFMNNGTLEVFASNGYVFVKRVGDNGTLLFLELETGIVRDCFSYYGLLGTMPCYHDNITDNAWNYGNNLLNNSSVEFNGLYCIFGVSMLASEFVGSSVLAVSVSDILGAEGVILEVAGGISAGTFAVIAIPLFIILFPDLANALWRDFVYLLNPNYKDYPNITMPLIDYQTQNIFCMTNNYVSFDLNQYSIFDYAIIILNDFRNYPYDKPTYDNYQRRLRDSRITPQPSLNAPGGDTPNSTGGTWEDVAEYIKELYDEFKSLDTTHEKIIFIKNNILKIFTISINFETIDLIEDLINLLLYELSQDTYNNSTNPSGGG